jgi:hypothetical protein
MVNLLEGLEVSGISEVQGESSGDNANVSGDGPKSFKPDPTEFLSANQAVHLKCRPAVQ